MTNAFWVNGSVTTEAEARVSVLDHGLLYGDGVFEGIRCVRGRIVDLELHLARLETSARAIHLELPARSELLRAVLETLAALGCQEAYVRLVVTRGVGSLGIDVASCKAPTLFCIAGELSLYAASPQGLCMVTVSLRRPSFDMLDPRVKSLNYLNNVLAKMEAKRQGADEALVLNQRGTVAEASGANIFACIDGVVHTPPAADGALGGITRRRVLKLLTTAEIATKEASLTRFDLLSADEVFLTGTGAGIVSVASLDGELLGTSRAVATRLKQMLIDYALLHGHPVAAVQSRDGEVAVAGERECRQALLETS